uniref:MCRI2 protein n=2 Tax=Passerellidae TaxID=1729112 RepID=A0A8C5JUJ6_JUNHY
MSLLRVPCVLCESHVSRMSPLCPMKVPACAPSMCPACSCILCVPTNPHVCCRCIPCASPVCPHNADMSLARHARVACVPARLPPICVSAPDPSRGCPPLPPGSGRRLRVPLAPCAFPFKRGGVSEPGGARPCLLKAPARGTCGTREGGGAVGRGPHHVHADAGPQQARHAAAHSPAQKLVFNRVNGKRPPLLLQQISAPEECYTLAHEENVRFVYEAWQQVEQQLDSSRSGDSACGPVQYVEKTPNPGLKNFVPIDLEDWWAQQFLAKIENSS